MRLLLDECIDERLRHLFPDVGQDGILRVGCQPALWACLHSASRLSEPAAGSAARPTLEQNLAVRELCLPR